MRLLFVTPYVPNLIRVRPFQFLRHLAKRGHQITLAALWSSETERGDLFALQEMGVRTVGAPHSRTSAILNCAAALPGQTPLQAAYCRSTPLAQIVVQEIARQPDAVHVEHLRGSPFLLAARRAIAGLGAQQSPALVWDSVDCISLLFEQAARASTSRRTRWLAHFELPRTRRHEGRLVHVADHTVTTAERDAEALRSLAKAIDPGQTPRVSVVPNGVDTETFRPNPSIDRAEARIVFSGKMSYHANATAALHLAQAIMPLIWRQRPDAELWLVGKDPGPEIAALASAGASRNRIVVTGEVASMAAELQQATVAAAPVPYGAGVQNKVLEAMACGIPVVASPQAVSALQAQPGEDLLVAGTPDAFAQHILDLLASPAMRLEIGANGRGYAASMHSWDAAAAQLEALYATR